jgi:hypothetical protein
MKLPSARNKTFLLLFLFSAVLAGVAFVFPEHKDYAFVGIWRYQSVKSGDSILFPVGPNDSLVILSSHTFYYDIQAPDKHMRGTWTLGFADAQKKPSSMALHFHYEPEGKHTRTFVLCKISGDSMNLCEGKTVFCLTRK